VLTTLTPRQKFLEDYAKIRAAEGRGSPDSAYYLALPFADLTGRNSAQWKIRARTFEYFRRRILPRTPSSILDLGAGNCWLSHRLAKLGHSPVAVDIFADPNDGLGAARHYPERFPVLEAEFDNLPVASESFDLAVFNSSIHYSTDYNKTLRETRRCLRRGAKVVILDSPTYKRREYGEAMRAERHAAFERQYGFRSDALPSIEFFDFEMLGALQRELRVHWTIHHPWYGWDWHLRPLRAFLKKQRPPSRFWILVGTFE
jgi:SAM-dependent methyltransferase